ncbi:MAG: type III pantothenate kinase [Spirochaetes bacterium]|nr:type III pantothenate kinase [Spirochaetota bacterium]
MFLGVDIGNTSTKVGVFCDNSFVPSYVFRFPTTREISPLELHRTIQQFLQNLQPLFFRNNNISGIAISCVVREVSDAYRAMAREHYSIEPLFINHETVKNISISYEHPEMLGADRIANAIAARKIYGIDAIVIDLGTATTFTVLHNGILIGGIISPGILTSAQSLLANTSMLVNVPLARTDSVIGQNTYDCIRSGLFFGWLSLIEGIVQKIFSEKGNTFPIIIVGGLSKIFAGHFSFPCIIDPLLTLKGIKIAWDTR